MVNISDSIMDVISSLSEDDISSLKKMADGLLKDNPSLASLAGQPGDRSGSHSGGHSGGESPLSPEILTKLGGIMSSFSGTDERIGLLLAIKPLLSPRRQKRADNAIQILKLLKILPAAGSLGLF